MGILAEAAAVKTIGTFHDMELSMHFSGLLGGVLENSAASTALTGSLTNTFLAGALVAGVLLAGAPRSAGAQSLEVGESFPEIVLPSLDGTPMSVSSFRGKKLAVHVWASW